MFKLSSDPSPNLILKDEGDFYIATAMTEKAAQIMERYCRLEPMDVWRTDTPNTYGCAPGMADYIAESCRDGGISVEMV